ncbi:zinc-dependent metalloprotease [Calothrix sp. FACHB-1219]|uniref:zinc-dependent metalloprotease n=1 Tax=unclassified Calothrix TaxID=2619626 RepID=UPI001682DF84|nr:MULTISPECIES: zinc-dependent metalloprotease [unclassified Calothrix]MBD2204236.1 zinc-dependent metalloprotease [Calothrix sp. FACHB-168]MBD2220542.1 zinc-dependent metalloprotease [Calothrix sp. FACHB-1219]
MNKLSLYVILLSGLFLGVTTTSAKSSPVNKINTELHNKQKQDRFGVNQTTPGVIAPSSNGKSSLKPLNKLDNYAKKPAVPTSQLSNSGGKGGQQVWVMNQNQQLQQQPFNWLVTSPKEAGKQPLLVAGKTPEKPNEKPNASTKPPKKDDLEAFDEVTKDTEKQQGLFTIYRQKEKNKIYLEIQPEQLNKNYLATSTLESGIGEQGIYSGMPLQDFLFYFKRLDNNLQFTVRNVNFRTKDGDPQARSLARSFSDSILYTIPIKSIHPERKTLLIDLGDLLLTDLAGLSLSLGIPGGTDQSYFGSAKVFPENIEVQTVLNFSGGGSSSSRENQMLNFESLADSRGFTLRIHYSLSQLPNNKYQPRLADERVGYFITAYQDLSKDDRGDPFVRYINRWNLEKADPQAPISRPKKPIVFWIDNAVPYEYRDAIKEGILMWNKAFLQAGFKDAIEARQMPDNATWDPADIRYNTIRWINTIDGFFARGPSRVNPLTGEILDADILVDGSFVRVLKNEYRQIVQPNQVQGRSSLTALMQNNALCVNKLAGKSQNNQQQQKPMLSRLAKLAGESDLCYGIEASNQFALGAMAMTLLEDNTTTQEQLKEYIHQYLRLIIAHEVGHTLGLRHNFRGSNLLPPEELNDKQVTGNKGLTASVMDYIPPNIAPQGTKQGDYFPSIVGPYDDWAIQYGYMPTQASTPIAEKPILDEIANQSHRPELSYSTDEDRYDLDPTANAWDNSGNVLRYAQWQLDNSRVMWDRLNKRYPVAGESYSDLSDRFGSVLGNYFQNIFYTTKYIGGQSFYRVHAGEPPSKAGIRQRRLPFEPVPLEEQRQALETLQKYVFAEDAFNFSPELLNKLAPSRWYHWGSYPLVGRLDYPIHDLVLNLQSAVLVDLLSGDRLSRLKDIELKSPQGKALSLPELFNTLQTGIWTEVIKPKGKPLMISSLRRGLQREYVNILSDIILRKEYVPEDARTLAWYKIRQLNEKLAGANSDDEYTKAHILETRDRIEKILNAPLRSN